ncbi:MAG: TetR/AcrR family transcriptional regulator [Microbacteriaceae bacterium]|nr:TetR/AcrR family transcriptional regulator [Microbacteriaceae bacterium]
MESTTRSKAKAKRRAQLLSAAAKLFAERGYSGTSIEDLGAAAGVSGPALYKHFGSKQQVLAAILLDASDNLLAGGTQVVSINSGRAALEELVAFHTEFALENPDVIRVQDRDLEQLAETDRHTVRSLQRRYVEIWVDVLAGLSPTIDREILRTRAHAVFGLLNSTPHSGLTLSQDPLRAELRKMALKSLDF